MHETDASSSCNQVRCPAPREHMKIKRAHIATLAPKSVGNCRCKQKRLDELTNARIQNSRSQLILAGKVVIEESSGLDPLLIADKTHCYGAVRLPPNSCCIHTGFPLVPG